MIINQATLESILQKIKEKGDDSCINQISKHGSNDWNYEEGLDVPTSGHTHNFIL